MQKILLFVTLVIFSHQAIAEIISSELFKAINDRLGYMEDVALFKAQNHLAIENIEREKVVIDKAKISAHEKGLDPDSVEEFFKAQISVAKAIQFRYRADLLSQPSFREPKDLKREIRPQLLSLGDQIIQQMARYIEAYGSFKPTGFADFDAAINVAYVTTPDKQLLFEALQKVKLLRKTD
ncbi:chorismate mutase [Gammaproteobacteria bacterium]|nr:chorismate mutase [Gammaproteobacteria bacterium]